MINLMACLLHAIVSVSLCLLKSAFSALFFVAYLVPLGKNRT
ncbi:hypothetical protein HMPREF9148_01153 [Prevotella sp. F0091]|nr:hypothetical protein HMPREF9148_01153 [Prevotella sp. F0091]